jgi:tetratricopeptide (TPR) repeat protein
VLIKHIQLFAAVAVLSICGSAWGQGSEADSVKGEVHLNSPAILRGEVTLSGLPNGREVGSATFGSDGRFEFRNVPYGEYRLTVLNGDKPIHEELVAVRYQQAPLEIEVAAPKAATPGSGSVSARELLHPPTKQAFKAFMAAQKLSQAGDHEKAAVQFEKATQLSPDYTDAWINLGAQYIYLKRYQQALEEFSRASEISRPTAMILGDMAFAQYALRHYPEGMRLAREALRLDPSSLPAHYLLGSFLAQDRRTRAEGIQHLEVAAAVMPAAREELNRVRRESVQPATHP